MRDNRFIELVNLYIDRQISVEETAELEAEMQANPKRRAVYKQYCQLHTATKQVYTDFRAQSAAPQAGASSGRVIRAEFVRRRPHWIHYAGGLAAAACLAVAFARYHAASTAQEPLAAATQPAPVQVAAVTPVAPAITAPAPVATPVNSTVTEPNYSELLKAVRQEEQRAFAAGELQPGRLPSLFDDGVFDTRSVFPANKRVFRGKQTPAAQFTAIEFQR